MPKTAQNAPQDAQQASEGDSPKKSRKPAKTAINLSGVDIDAVHKTQKKKNGRPSKYTPELAREICERLSNGEPLRQICRDDHMPSWVAVYGWSARDAELSSRIAHAREMGYDAIAEEALLIADTPVMGEKQVMGDDKTYTTVEDMLGHRKLQIETRLKLLAKWNPKKYGDRVAHEGVADGAPIKVDHGIFDALIQNIELQRQSEE